jgi:peptidoglycan/xylan/chitin deacetylase (PgdA/CDA1 family)
MPRFISFRLDDGFIKGALSAAAHLYPNRASYFIVSNLVMGIDPAQQEPLFVGRNFGSIAEWRAISRLGHDVQPHGAVHNNISLLSLEQQLFEIKQSLSFIRYIHDGPYVFGYPYNAMTDLDLSKLGISAAGFETIGSDDSIIFNKIGDGLDLYRLKSWAVRERHFDSITEQLSRDLPDDSWAILAFHSLDGEGHEPWTSDRFSRLIAAIRAMGHQIVTVGEMVERLSRYSANGVSGVV